MQLQKYSTTPFRQMNLAFGTVSVEWRDGKLDAATPVQLRALQQAGIESGKFTADDKLWDEIKDSVQAVVNQFYQHMLRQADDEPLQAALESFNKIVLVPHPLRWQAVIAQSGNVAYFILRFRPDVMVNVQFKVFPEDQPPNIGLFIVDIDGPAPSPLEFTLRAERAGLTCTDAFLAIVQQVVDTCKLSGLREIRFEHPITMRVRNTMQGSDGCDYSYHRLMCKSLLVMDVIFRVGARTRRWARTFGALTLDDDVCLSGAVNKWYAYAILPSAAAARSLDCQLDNALCTWSKLDAAQKEKFATILPYL